MATSRSFGCTSLTTRSPIESCPSEGSSSPAIMRSAVDLPQPDGPTNTMNSWSWIARSRFSITLTSPKRLAMPWNAMRAIALPRPPLHLSGGLAHEHARLPCRHRHGELVARQCRSRTRHGVTHATAPPRRRRGYAHARVGLAAIHGNDHRVAGRGVGALEHEQVAVGRETPVTALRQRGVPAPRLDQLAVVLAQR